MRGTRREAAHPTDSFPKSPRPLWVGQAGAPKGWLGARPGVRFGR